MQNLEFALLVFGYDLLQYFLICSPSSLWNDNVYSVPVCVGSDAEEGCVERGFCNTLPGGMQLLGMECSQGNCC